jgi:hypothetical protein
MLPINLFASRMIRIIGRSHEILQEYSLFMRNSELVAVIHKLNHDKPTSTANLPGRLRDGSRIERGCIGIYCKYRVPSTRILEGPQYDDLTFGQVENYKGKRSAN